MSVYLFMFILIVSFYTFNLNLNKVFYKITFIQDVFKSIALFITTFFKEIRLSILKNSSFLPRYYHRNENLWVDGFLFDFLQKKSADLWIRKFVIYTGFIFSERLVFDSVVRLYLDNILWPMHYFSLFEANNVLEMLLINIFFYFLFFAMIVLLYICLF